MSKLSIAAQTVKDNVSAQAVGRVQRVADGKGTPVVYDFVDDIGFCMGAYKKRCSSYRKIGAEIEKG